jgi:uncharacterized protein (DUF1778 family)
MPKKGEKKEVRKDAQIQFRVNSDKKKEIQSTSNTTQLSMSEYLIGLHDKNIGK